MKLQNIAISMPSNDPVQDPQLFPLLLFSLKLEKAESILVSFRMEPFFSSDMTMPAFYKQTIHVQDSHWKSRTKLQQPLDTVIFTCVMLDINTI